MSRVRNSPRGLVELAATMTGELHHFFEVTAPNMGTARHMWRELCERLEHLRIPEKMRDDPRGYIRSVASVVAADWGGSKGARVPAKRTFGGNGPMNASTQAEVLSQAQRRLRKARVARLSWRRRLAWIWVEEVRLPQKWAAVAMGIELSTVRSHIRDARRILRELEEKEPDES